jgi:hypothetical protein
LGIAHVQDEAIDLAVQENGVDAACMDVAEQAGEAKADEMVNVASEEQLQVAAAAAEAAATIAETMSV